VNAAFLLVTTAWLAGADAAPAAAAPEKPAATTLSCTGGCGACCDTHEGLWTKLKGRLHRGDECCNPCPKPACAPAPAPKCNPCDTCPKESCFSKIKGMFHRGGNCNACAPAHKPSCGACSSCCEETHASKLRGKLHGMFHRGGECCASECGTAPAHPGEPIKAPKDGEPGKKLPSGDKETSIPAGTDITPVSGAETKSPFELSPRYESRAGHAPDYSWLTGQLFYVHADGGLWVLRYAPLSTEDANGGGVVLARDLRMDSYRDGDLVTVHGQLLGQKSSIFLGGPLYQGKTIELIERGTQD
jgi:hypothetical protein